MSNLIVTIAVVAGAVALFLSQRASFAKVRGANTQLAAQAIILRAQTTELDQLRADLQRRLDESGEQLRELRQEQSKGPAPTPEAIVPPDPARQGGWPVHARYFYLPKRDLGSIGYQLFDANRLTDDAAVLFGMTADEREAVDAAYDEMWRKFRDMEIQRMERVELPEKWRHAQNPALNYESISYRVPSLESEARDLRTSFESSLHDALGPTRANLLSEAVSDHIQTRLDDLGRQTRVITFGRIRQPNGEIQTGYAELDEVTGVGNYRLIQQPLEPDSQAAYYARLFGVDVPIASK